MGRAYLDLARIFRRFRLSLRIRFLRHLALILKRAAMNDMVIIYVGGYFGYIRFKQTIW